MHVLLWEALGGFSSQLVRCLCGSKPSDSLALVWKPWPQVLPGWSETETLSSAESSAKLLVVQKPMLMTGIDSTLLWQHDFVHVDWDVLDVPDNVSTMAIRAHAWGNVSEPHNHRAFQLGSEKVCILSQFFCVFALPHTLRVAPQFSCGSPTSCNISALNQKLRSLGTCKQLEVKSKKTLKWTRCRWRRYLFHHEGFHNNFNNFVDLFFFTSALPSSLDRPLHPLVP